MNKKFILIGLSLLILLSSAHATVSNYTVPSSVPLGKILTVDGQISPIVSNVQCSIRILNDNNILVHRLTDEFTTSNGIFSSSYLVITEPLFKRETDYNVATDCAGSAASSTVTIAQRESIAHTLEQETLFIFDRGNIDSYFFFGILILIVILVIISLVVWYKTGRGAFNGRG